jgi:hypothetical protein
MDNAAGNAGGIVASAAGWLWPTNAQPRTMRGGLSSSGAVGATGHCDEPHSSYILHPMKLTLPHVACSALLQLTRS